MNPCCGLSMVIYKCICLQTYVHVQNKYLSTEILKDTRGESEDHYVRALKLRDKTDHLRCVGSPAKNIDNIGLVGVYFKSLTSLLSLLIPSLDCRLCRGSLILNRKRTRKRRRSRWVHRECYWVFTLGKRQ